MYTRIINDLTLNESLFEYNKAMEFSSIFDKVGIYSKNLQLINEGNRTLGKDILFNLNEREQLNDMFSYIEFKLLENYLDEASISSLMKWLKNKGTGAKNTVINVGQKIKTGTKNVGNKVKDFVVDLSKLPQKIKNAIQFIEKILNKGIHKVSEFIKYIAGLLASLGATIKDAVMSFGIFKDSELKNSPKLDHKFDSLKELDPDEKSNNIFNYVMRFVFDKCKDKSYKTVLNEDSQEAEYSDSGTATLDKWALSYKDSWKEKSKNNTLFRLFLSGTNASGERLGFFKVLLISIIGSFIVCTLVPLIASSVFGLAGTGLVILVIACKALWVVKNVARIIINRTLTYKQSFKIDKNGNLKHSRLFDNLTIASLCIAVITPAIFTIFHDEITNWLHSLFDHNTPDPEPLVKETNPEVIEQKIIEQVETPKPNVTDHVSNAIADHAASATPDPKPVITEILNTDIEPAKVVQPADPIPEVKSEVVVAVKTPDVVEHIPAKVTAETTKEAVQQVNQAVGNTVSGDLNQYNITNIDNSTTNVYNGASQQMGGMPRGVVVLHDHGHPHRFFGAVRHGGGRIIVERNHTHVVQMPHHEPGHHGGGTHFGRPRIMSDHGTPFKPGSAATRPQGGMSHSGGGRPSFGGGGRPSSGMPHSGGGRLSGGMLHGGPGGGHGQGGGPRR